VGVPERRNSAANGEVTLLVEPPQPDGQRQSKTELDQNLVKLSRVDMSRWNSEKTAHSLLAEVGPNLSRFAPPLAFAS
jgi:hypothetical protein